MGYDLLKPKKTLIAILFTQALLNTQANASGFYNNHLSVSLQGEATAGAAATKNDVSTLFINPASLSSLQENQFYLGISDINHHIEMQNATAMHTYNIPDLLNTSVRAWVSGDNYQKSLRPSKNIGNAYLGWQINKSLVAGLAINSPFYFETNYATNSVVRFSTLYARLNSLVINPALAYRYNQHWAFGIGLLAENLRLKFSSFNGFYSGNAAIDSFLAARKPSFIDTDGWNYGYNLGVYYNYDEQTRFGIGYRSRVRQTLKGDSGQYLLPGELVMAPSKAFPFNGSSEASAYFNTPAVLTLSAVREYANWTFKGSAQITFWNTFDYLTLSTPESFMPKTMLHANWRNTLLVALGIEDRVSELLTLKGGLAFDQSPTTGVQGPWLPDSDVVWLSTGISYLINKIVSIDGSYAHGFYKNQTINNIDVSGTPAVATRPLEVNQIRANYKSFSNVWGVALRFHLD